jgi:hypothetical protein
MPLTSSHRAALAGKNFKKAGKSVEVEDCTTALPYAFHKEPLKLLALL